jgi:hypothetical protein
VYCDEAIYELNRINEFRLGQNKKGKRALEDKRLDFDCQLVGGAVLNRQEILVAQMSDAENAYKQQLNNIGNQNGDFTEVALLQEKL